MWWTTQMAGLEDWSYEVRLMQQVHGIALQGL